MCWSLAPCAVSGQAINWGGILIHGQPFPRLADGLLSVEAEAKLAGSCPLNVAPDWTNVSYREHMD
jgi:hypothetical protein